MSQSVETSETKPWRIRTVLEALDRIHPLDAGAICRQLRGEAAALAAALQDVTQQVDGERQVTAAALLLMLNDTAGREPFLAALAGPDGDQRILAIEYLDLYLSPLDLSGNLSRQSCPLTSDEVFDALKRDLHEPWTGHREKILTIMYRQDFPQVRSLTRALLSHPDRILRRRIAESYLETGRDEGAFAAIEDALRGAPAHLPLNDPAWHDFYQIKRSWHTLEQAALRGGAELRKKAAGLTMGLVEEALSAPDAARCFDTNEGLIRACHAANTLAAVMPDGAKDLLERMIASEALSDYDRGKSLLAYARALGAEARPILLASLGSPELRAHAADALRPLAEGKNDPEYINALSAALAGEERPNAVAALAGALLAASPAARPVVELALDRCEPWTRAELAWRIGGGTDRQFADMLTEAGAMDAITDDELAEALRSGFDIRSLIWAGGERLAQFGVKASTGMEHFALFDDLLKVARPSIAVDDLTETVNANLVREEAAHAPNVEQVIDLGTVCTVNFRYQGQVYRFEAHPEGRWHDVAAVVRGFRDFMQAIGRDDRCYELEGGGEWALFVVAPASKFEPIAAQLRIPLERDSESARDAAKAYQRQTQNL